ncbi:dienelactone hydrolase family protein [Pseudonocardia pini]|uniref:dienelactone hydrolase family protein n=1 Tax=Pseudonocardia pini TaxID=2758030 RepID=UPI0015F05504|nr:dienelactone hydrolase family protein [Pseudonocardia pini]
MESDVSLPRIEPLRSTRDLPTGTVEVAEIRLSGLPRGAVLVLCSAAGLDTHAPELMNALAEHGYETLAAAPGGPGLTEPELVAAIDGLLVVLTERGWQREQVGVIGYGEAGRAALLAAGAMRLGAAVSVSPSGVLDGPVPTLRTPWLGLFGELGTPPEAVATLRRLLADAPEFSRLVVYPGADADFFRGAADALGHAASFDSWQRVVEWLNVRVVPRPSPYAELWASRQEPKPSDHPRQGSAR